MTRRATSVSIASSAGSSNRPPVSGIGAVTARHRRRARLEAERAVRSASPGATSRPGSAPSSAVESGSGRPVRRRSAPARGRRARAARRAAAAARSARGGRPPASTSTVNSPSSKNGAEKSGSPVGAMTSEPPQNEIDSSTPDAVAEDHERRRELGVGPHERPPRRRRPEADLVRRRQVAARATTRR